MTVEQQLNREKQERMVVRKFFNRIQFLNPKGTFRSTFFAPFVIHTNLQPEDLCDLILPAYASFSEDPKISVISSGCVYVLYESMEITINSVLFTN